MSAVLEKSMAGLREASGRSQSFVTMRVNRQMVGIPVIAVQDVLKRMVVARVPLAPRQVAGVINLRGRIVTVLDMRRRLALPASEEGAECMHCVVEHQDELFSLMVDSVGDVLSVPSARIDRAPPNLEEHWKSVASGVVRLEGELLVILDIQALLTI